MSSWFENARKRYKIGRETPQYWAFPMHQCGYIQIPKVATRSIRACLLESFGRELGVSELSELEDTYSQHLSLGEIRKTSNGVLVFAFVRDPYARLHSAYIDKIVNAEKSGRKNIFECHKINFGISFSSFVERVAEIDDSTIDRHLRSQSWFLADAAGLIPSFVGKMESLEADWESLRSRVGGLGPLPSKNVAARGMDVMSNYSESAMRCVQARYAEDFERFGY